MNRKPHGLVCFRENPSVNIMKRRTGSTALLSESQSQLWSMSPGRTFDTQVAACKYVVPGMLTHKPYILSCVGVYEGRVVLFFPSTS